MKTLLSDAALPIDVKSPRDAMAALSRVLREATVPGERETVRLSWSASRAPTIFRRLAESLPADAADFTVADETQRRTASEVVPLLVPKARLYVHYAGALTRHRSAAAAVEFLAGLIDGAPPGESRGLSCSVDVAGLTFRGAPPGSTGVVHLSDMFAFKRRTRFALSARVFFPGSSAKDASARATVRAIAAASSLPFREKLVEISDAPVPSERNGVAALCIEDAFAEAASRFGWNHAGWRAVPGFCRDASDPIGGSAAAPGERVNFAAIAKRVVRETLPSLSPGESAPGPLFRLPLTDELELTLSFRRERGPRIGRRYSLALALQVTRGPSHGVVVRSTVSALLQRDDHDFWLSYTASADLESQLRRVAPLLGEALDALAAIVRARLSPLPESLPDDARHRGAITAREGLAAAVEAATGAVKDATLLEYVGSHSQASARHGVGGPGLGVDGRVAPHAGWFYILASPTEGLGVRVTVPAFGRPRVVVGRRHWRADLGSDWIDSDEALRRSEVAGGAAARAAATKTWEILASLQSNTHAPTGPHWTVQYLQEGPRGRVDYQAEVEAN